MRTYELAIVLRSSLKDTDRTKLLDTIKSWLQDAKIVKEEDWGSKALKYAIKKELTGHYFYMFLETVKTIPADLEKRLLSEEKVLRHLLVRTK
jgi:ribosomal protein S6